MTYLKISNRGSLHRKKLELIGFTSKRDAGPETIGHKGSGTKLAAVASLRLGLNAVVASTDSLGQYLLRYETQEIDVDGMKAEQVYFHYQATSTQRGSVRNPTNMVIEAFQDWDKTIGKDDKRSFKVLREFICNALDEDRSFTLALVEQAPAVPEGETAVYITYITEIRQVFAEIARYFKFFKGVPAPLFSVDGLGDIYPKSEDGKTRLFVQGVLVDCDDNFWRDTLYDYSLREKTLVSEERIIKSSTDYETHVGRLLGQLTDRDMAKNILEAIARNTAHFEESALGRVEVVTPPSAKVWLSVLHEMHGKELAVASGNVDKDKDCEQIFGKTPIGAASESLQHFFSRLGIPLAKDIVPSKETMKYEVIGFDDFEEPDRRRFLGAFRKLAARHPDRAFYPIEFRYPLDENLRKYAGLADIGGAQDGKCSLMTTSRTTLDEDEEEIYLTLLHETRHLKTGAPDYNRNFIEAADRDASRADYGPPPVPNGIWPNFVLPAKKHLEILEELTLDLTDLEFHPDPPKGA